MALHIRKQETDDIELSKVGDEFVTGNEHRQNMFVILCNLFLLSLSSVVIQKCLISSQMLKMSVIAIDNCVSLHRSLIGLSTFPDSPGGSRHRT